MKKGRYWFKNGTFDNGDWRCSIVEDGVVLSSNCTWSQATRFCQGESLYDLSFVQLSIF